MTWVQGDTTLGQVFLDINTQWDFLDPEGSLPVRNRESLIPRLRRLMAAVRAMRVSLISCIELHRSTDSFYGIPLCCLEGTPGQSKLPFTLLNPRVLVHADNSFDLPYNVMSRYRQVIFYKQNDNLFSNPKADRLLTELEPQEYVLFGIGIERWIKSIALGLMARHKKVALVADACGYWVEADADLAMRQLRAKGVRLLTVDEMTQTAGPLRRHADRPTRSSSRHHPAGQVERRRVGSRGVVNAD